MAGIGPATSPLPRECSTTEPHGRLMFKYALQNQSCKLVFGAGDETRTRDIQFGKLKLYQLSYTRASILTSANRLKLYSYYFFCKIDVLQTLVEGEGFEPSYSERTDLQSVAFNHSATPPNRTHDYAENLTDCQIV